MTNESAYRIGWQVAQQQLLKVRTCLSVSLLANVVLGITVAILLL